MPARRENTNTANNNSSSSRTSVGSGSTAIAVRVAEAQKQLSAVERELADAQALGFLEDLPALQARRAALQQALQRVQTQRQDEDIYGVALDDGDGDAATDADVAASGVGGPGARPQPPPVPPRVQKLRGDLAGVEQRLQVAATQQRFSDAAELQQKRETLRKELAAAEAEAEAAADEVQAPGRGVRRPSSPVGGVDVETLCVFDARCFCCC